MKFIQPIDLDVSRCRLYKYLYAKQGDTDSRFIQATIISGGTKMEFTDGETAKIRALKPDGTSVLNDAVIQEDHTVLAELTEQMLAVGGLVSADLVIFGASGEVLSTANFRIEVEAAPIGKTVTSSNEFLTLVNLIDRAERTLGDYDTALEQLEDIRDQAKSYADAVNTEQLNARIEAKADDLWFDEDAGLLHLTSGGKTIGSGVKIASTGSGGVSSWNDLTDKPFYEETTPEVLREYTALVGFSSQSSYGGLYGRGEEPPGYELVLGETYVVMYDGIAYECVAQDASAMAAGAIALGNLTFFNDGVGTGEPFIIGWLPEGVIYLDTDMVSPKTSHEIGIYHNATVVKKLDAKFLPEGTATEAYVRQYVESYINEALGGEF